MEWLEFDSAACSIRRSLDVIGQKWTLLILRDAVNGVRRFDQLRDHLGVSDPMLAERLRTLVAAGLLASAPYSEPGQRVRKEYRLTDKGRDLYPVLIALLQWGDKHCSEPDGPPVRVTHRDCGEPVEAKVMCAAGHELTSPSESQTAPGPGAQEKA
ncbi:winged helix-turn-helix transcriptional regulator [Brevibacterium sp. CFH 10365]|uniref:winged helix-turn-helix transcriptional regulator n=1 Tax=Brevibacterium sp. CFH 10365 TaxID=2585207 RepID=UPI0012664116|nr:helix-turn-helix domain-containing protein [Brevibacterium sp. CFH 10365]